MSKRAVRYSPAPGTTVFLTYNAAALPLRSSSAAPVGDRSALRAGREAGVPGRQPSHPARSGAFGITHCWQRLCDVRNSANTLHQCEQLSAGTGLPSHPSLNRHAPAPRRGRRWRAATLTRDHKYAFTRERDPRPGDPRRYSKGVNPSTPSGDTCASANCNTQPGGTGRWRGRGAGMAWAWRGL
eukprot:gene10980-biopygen16832